MRRPQGRLRHLGISAGYQLTPDLYAKLIYEYNTVELIDGTVDVAPVGLGFEASNDYGWAKYLTGEHQKNRIGLDFSYFLSGVEFGGTIDYLWGRLRPDVLHGLDGQRVRLVPRRAATTSPRRSATSRCQTSTTTSTA